MKIYLLAYLAFVSLSWVPTKGQEAVHIHVPVVEVPVEVKEELAMEMDEEVVEVPDEEDIDVARMFGDLIESNFVVPDKPKKDSNQKVKRDIEEVRNVLQQPVTDPEIVLKYNTFMDAFLTRLSNSMRLNHDPMKLVIRQSGKIDADENPFKNKGKKNKFGGRNNSPNNDRKPQNRHPKDIALSDEKVAKTDEGKSERIKREVLSKPEDNLEEYDEEYYDDDTQQVENNELEGRALNDEEYDLMYDDYYEDEEYIDGKSDVKKVENTREGRELSPTEVEPNEESARSSTQVEGRQRRRRVRRRRPGQGRRKCGKFCQRRRRRLRRRRLRNRRRGKRSIEAPSAMISGISNMRRFGNVQIMEGRESQDIFSKFDIGPIILRAQRSYGKGSKVDIREAQATASSVRGELIVTVNQDGSARVKRLQLMRPESIQVSGTLRRKDNLSSDKAMQGLVRRTRPVVARKMRQAAAKIFRTTIIPNSNINN